jgi:hypothetical protein
VAPSSYATHGLGGAEDLPIPLGLAIAGAGAALVLTVVVLLLAWREPRFAEAPGRPMPARLARAVDGTGLHVALRLLGLLLLGFGVWAAVAGEDELTNPVFGMAYAWLWVGIVPASLLFGPIVKAISPARTLHLVLARVAGDADSGARAWPSWLGSWPAAAGLLAFVWLELVSPDGTSLKVISLWFAVYLGAMVIGGLVFGTVWFEHADPFEVYSSWVARLSIWGRREDGTLVLRSPLSNLAARTAGSGDVAVVAVLLGSTAFDSLRSSIRWVRYSQTSGLDTVWLNSGLLLAMCVVVAVAFGLAAPGPPRTFAHSVVPIVIGYMVAHYLSFFVEIGQQTLIQASDPLGRGWNLFGTADWTVDYWLSMHPPFLATVKVLAIVLGHVVGAVAAHDRALEVLPEQRRVAGQLPLLGVMVLYTVSGLYLLFSA